MSTTIRAAMQRATRDAYAAADRAAAAAAAGDSVAARAAYLDTKRAYRAACAARRAGHADIFGVEVTRRLVATAAGHMHAAARK